MAPGPPPKRRRTSPSPDPLRAKSSSASPQKRTHAEAPSSKSLHNFFQPASEEQRWTQKFESKPLDPVKEADGDDDDDIIDDDSDSYDELFTKHFSNWTPGPAPAPGAQPRQNPRSQRRRSSDTSRKLTSSKSFLMPSSTAQRKAPEVELDNERPWAQRFSPSNLDELAVHKKKIADVRSWLETAFTGSNRRVCARIPVYALLVLRGPAGCGKSTTVSLLSKSLGFDILEWRNPSASDFTERGYASVSSQFAEFLGRSNEFGGLDLDSPGDTEGRGTTTSQRRVLLIEEFPTILSRTSSSLAAFRSSFQQHLAAAGVSQSSAEMSSPIVVIVSETHLNSVSSVLDNLTVHRLLGPDISNHPGTTIIDFNSIAPTFMHKALKLVLEKEARHSRRSRVPGQAVLKTIAEVGDIRSAISSLEFLCVKCDTTGAWGASLPSRSKKKPRDSVELTSMEKESLKMITQREASLGIFHAVGKIVYNKRDDPSLVPDAIQLPPPPEHRHHHARRKISQVAVNELVDETGTDIQTFISALHENYALSCHGSSFTDTLNGCIDALSDSDIQCAERRGPGSRAGVRTGTGNFTAGVDSLRQHEISYQVAARGLLFSLPHPVKRSLPSAGGRSHAGDAHKMLFPSSIRLWHESEEIDGLIDLWATRLLSPSANRGAYAQDDSNDMRAMPVTMLSRDEMLLHQLPYMAQIKRNDVAPAALERITGFNTGREAGSNGPGGLSDSWDSQGLVHPARRKQDSASSEGEERLILSDDDIED